MGRINKKFIYSIILTNHDKQLKTIKSEKTETKVYKTLNKLLKENKEKVIFPVRYNNHKHVMIPSQYELAIIKCKQDNDKHVTEVRDNSGKFVKYQTSDEDWIVIDRVPYEIEETFFVYGYHPRLQRKDFKWIYDNLISINPSSFKTIVLYLNKIIIEANGKIDLVICKNKDDGIRMYNMLEEWSRKNKLKYNIFLGDMGNSDYKNEWINKIQKLTNWSRLKIRRPSTRP